MNTQTFTSRCRFTAGLFLIAALAMLCACSSPKNETPTAATPTSAPVTSKAEALVPIMSTPNPGGESLITASPNPIQVCNGSRFGTTTISWKAPANVKYTQVWIDSVTGGGLIASGEGTGSSKTGEWVKNGTKVLLQDITKGAPGVTIGTVIVGLTNEGCK